MGQEHPALLKMNGGSLNDPRVTVLNDDAYVCGQYRKTWSVIIMDFPDPHGEALAKLYSVRFYRQISALLTLMGLLSHRPRLLILREKRFGAFAKRFAQLGFTRIRTTYGFLVLASGALL